VTVPVVTNSDTPEPITVAVTFILTALCTITVRYGDPKPFRLFSARATRQRGLALSSEAVLVGLLEAIVDRAADLYESIGGELDGLSQHVFRSPGPTHRRRRQSASDLQAVLRGIGRNGDLASKVSDSLLGVARASTYLGQDDAVRRKDCKARLKTMTRDVRSLTEHGVHIANKINFMLDATLGMINIQQNNIIKIFSVVAVIFLPPTLVASMYGMNYKHMPELEWEYGYLWALFLMFLSAALPYLYFKRKGWL
jgi:magnesium transporter